ncbi:metal ABC transporter solute-binding protein, Zn/Mn family [Zhihengliuella sp.]|uniref:metal ABC transporter solute-binding protein, Zn/Mn family n=1 Tax=Zhihengliuella sp. TaxID=1954483 RepID=UPI0028114344|nr:zinc ABC transporter substrate-binding protein [Zhihengliuella sp.]
MRRRPLPLLAVGLTAGTLVLAGCSTGAASGGGDEGGAGGITVVASTSVYGDIAEKIGGDGVSVESIVDSVAQDPHSYEATVQDKLAVSKADVVIANGGGYDAFMEQLLADTEVDPARIVTVSELAEAAHAEGDAAPGENTGGTASPEASHEGHDDAAHDEAAHDEAAHGHEHGDGNEHVWYDFHVMQAAAEEVAAALVAADPGNRQAYEDNAAALGAELGELETRVQTLAEGAGGRSYAMTEPLPYYLMEEAGLTDATPEGYSETVEHGESVPPLLQKELLDALAAGEIAVLAYNPQSASPQTEAVRAAAEEAGVPVVDLTETLPDDQDYADWMSANLDALEAALAG